MKVICDTSIVVVLYHLDLLEYLNLLYKEVLIPEEVEGEFLRNDKLDSSRNDRLDFLLKFYHTHRSWFKKCTDYNQADIDLYLTQKGIDKGEAEVFAQHQVKGSQHHLLLDENTARKHAKSLNISINGVLKVLALMDTRLKVCDYWECVPKLTHIRFHVTSKIVDMVWDEVNNENP